MFSRIRERAAILVRRTPRARGAESHQRGIRSVMAPQMPVFMHDIEWGMYAAILLAANPRVVLEWGSGGSTAATLSLLPGLQRMVAIEHHVLWFQRVQAEISDPRLELYLCEPTVAQPERSPQVEPRQYTAQLANWFERCEREPAIMQDYVSKPAECGVAFDLILVDGRARNACLRQGYELLRPGGIMVIHDAQRAEYRETLESFPEHRFLEPWVQGQLCIVSKPA